MATDLTACCQQDDGGTWAAVPVDNWTSSGPWSENQQTFHGIGISSAGVIFLSHGSNKDWPDGLYGQDLFVSRSDDFGLSWEASETDFGSALSPGV